METKIVLTVTYRGVPYEVISNSEEEMSVSDLESRLLIEVGQMMNAIREYTGEFESPEDGKLYGQ